MPTLKVINDELREFEHKTRAASHPPTDDHKLLARSLLAMAGDIEASSPTLEITEVARRLEIDLERVHARLVQRNAHPVEGTALQKDNERDPVELSDQELRIAHYLSGAMDILQEVCLSAVVVPEAAKQFRHNAESRARRLRQVANELSAIPDLDDLGHLQSLLEAEYGRARRDRKAPDQRVERQSRSSEANSVGQGHDGGNAGAVPEVAEVPLRGWAPICKALKTPNTKAKQQELSRANKTMAGPIKHVGRRPEVKPSALLNWIGDIDRRAAVAEEHRKSLSGARAELEERTGIRAKDQKMHLEKRPNAKGKVRDSQ